MLEIRGKMEKPQKIFLPITEHTSISIDLEDALTFNKKQFVKFYKEYVHGSKKEASQWADMQIAARILATVTEA